MDVDVVVKGRAGVEVPDHFREHVSEKLSKVVRLDASVSRLEVELVHERNPRQSDVCQRVEVTCRSRGPVVRAEASSDDFYTALDTASHRLEQRLRRAADRRSDRGSRHSRRSVRHDVPPGEPGVPGVLPGDAVGSPLPTEAPSPGPQDEPSADGPAADGVAAVDPDEQVVAGGVVVREKQHPAEDLSLEEALDAMELVGHDFYLFCDAESGRPSVVYRRHAYDYGVLRLAERVDGG